MPFGVWGEADWKDLDAGLKKRSVPAAQLHAFAFAGGSSTRKLGPLQRQPPDSQEFICSESLSLHDVEARSAPLLRALSDIRRVKTAPIAGGNASSSRTLPTARTASGRVGAKDPLALDRPAKALQRSAHTVRTWSDLGEQGSKSIFTYAVPLSNASTSLQSFRTSLQSFGSMGTSQFAESMDELFDDAPPDGSHGQTNARHNCRLRRTSSQDKGKPIAWRRMPSDVKRKHSTDKRSSIDQPDKSFFYAAEPKDARHWSRPSTYPTGEDAHLHWLDIDWTETMTLEEVIRELPNTNLTSHSAPDTLTKLIVATAESATTEPEKAVTEFTRRYFAACNMYGQMIDQVRNITRNVVCLDIELGGSLLAPEEEESGLKVGGLMKLSGRSLQTMKHDQMYHEAKKHERTMLVDSLKQTLARLGTFNWDQMVFEFRKWIQAADLGEVILRELIDQISEQNKEVLSLLSLSRYLIEESIGMHLLSAARTLTDFHDRIVEQMREVELKTTQGKKTLTHHPKWNLIRSRIDQLADDRDRQMRQLEVNRNLYNHMVTASSKDDLGHATLAEGGREDSDKQMVTFAADENPKQGSKRPAGKASKISVAARQEAEGRRNAHLENRFMRCLIAAKQAVDQISGSHHERSAILKKLKQSLRRSMRKQQEQPKRRFTEMMEAIEGLDADERVEVRWLLKRQKELWDDLNHLTVKVSIRDMLTWQEANGRAAMPRVTFGSLEDVPVSELHAKLKEKKRLTQSRKSIALFQKGVQEVQQGLSLQKAEGNTTGRAKRNHRRRQALLPGGLTRRKASEDSGSTSAHEDRQDRMAALEELETKAAKLDKQYQVRIFNMREAVHKTNDQYGEQTWSFDSEQLVVWFQQNPTQWLMQAIHEAITELEEAPMDDDLQEGLVDISRDVETLLSEFKKEVKARKRALDNRMPFDAAQWEAKVTGPTRMVIMMFREWLAQAKQRGFGFQSLECMQGGQEEEEGEYELSEDVKKQLKDRADQLDALQKWWETEHSKIVETRKENEEFVVERANYKNIALRLQAFSEQKAKNDAKQSTLDDMIQEIKRIMIAMKNLQMGAIRSGIGGLTSIKPVKHKSLSKSHEPKSHEPKSHESKSHEPDKEEDATPTGNSSSLRASLQKRLNLNLDDKGRFQTKITGHEELSPEEEKKKEERKEKSFSNSGRKNKLLESGKAKRFTMLGAKLSKEDASKLRGHIEVAQTQGKVLEVRMHRKQQELARLCQRLTQQQSGGKRAPQEKSAHEIREQIEKEMKTLRTQLASANKMLDFWRNRIELWQKEIVEQHGADIWARLEVHRESLHLHHMDDKKENKKKSMLEMLPTERRRQSYIFKGRQSVHATPTMADSWEASKASRVSKAFETAFSALNARETIHRSTVTSHHSDVMKLMQLRNGRKNSQKMNTFDFDDEAFGIGRSSRGAKETHFGGGFSYNKGKASLRALDVGRASLFAGGVEPLAAKRIGPGGLKRGIVKQSTSHNHMQVLNYLMAAPLSGGQGLWHGHKLKAQHKSPMGFASIRRSPAARLYQKMQESGVLNLEGHHMGGDTHFDMQVAPRGKGKDKGKGKGKGRGKGRDVEMSEPKEKGEDKNFSPYRSLGKDYLKGLGEETEFQKTTSRLDALRNRKKRQSLARLKNGSVLKNNVCMLKMFIDDVPQNDGEDHEFGAYSQQPSRAGSPTEAEKDKANRQNRRRLTAALQAHGEQGDLVSALTMMDGSNKSSSSSSGSFSSTSSDSDGTSATQGVEGRKSATSRWRKVKTLDADEDEQNPWTEFNELQRALTMLRACRDKLVQRFGGVDKAYVKCTPAVVGMTAEVWREIVGMMGYEEKHAEKMFHLISTLVPKSRKPRDKGRILSPLKSMEKPSVARSDFSEVMRSIAPVRSFVQLRMRLRRKYPSLDAAWTVLCGSGDRDASSFNSSRSRRSTVTEDVVKLMAEAKRRPSLAPKAESKPRPLSATPLRKASSTKSLHEDPASPSASAKSEPTSPTGEPESPKSPGQPPSKKSINWDAEEKEKERSSDMGVKPAVFRDFLASVGVTANEAKVLFHRMIEHNDKEPETGAPPEVSKHAFILTLAHADGIDALANLKIALDKILPTPNQAAPDEGKHLMSALTKSSRRTSAERQEPAADHGHSTSKPIPRRGSAEDSAKDSASSQASSRQGSKEKLSSRQTTTPSVQSNLSHTEAKTNKTDDKLPETSSSDRNPESAHLPDADDDWPFTMKSRSIAITFGRKFRNNFLRRKSLEGNEGSGSASASRRGSQRASFLSQAMKRQESPKEVGDINGESKGSLGVPLVAATRASLRTSSTALPDISEGAEHSEGSSHLAGVKRQLITVTEAPSDHSDGNAASADEPGLSAGGTVKRRSVQFEEPDKSTGAEASTTRKDAYKRRDTALVGKLRQSLQFMSRMKKLTVPDNSDKDKSGSSRSGSPFGVTSFAVSAPQSRQGSIISPPSPAVSAPQSRSGSFLSLSGLPIEEPRSHSGSKNLAPQNRLASHRNSSRSPSPRNSTREANDLSMCNGQATVSQVDSAASLESSAPCENNASSEAANRNRSISPSPARRNSLTSKEAGQQRRNSLSSKEAGQQAAAHEAANREQEVSGPTPSKNTDQRRRSVDDFIKNIENRRRRSSSGWASGKEVRFAVLNLVENVEEDKEKAMYNMCLKTIALKTITETTPIVEDVFRECVVPLGLSPEDVHSIFKLSTMFREQQVPIQDVILRAVGGLGYRYDKLRERLELPPQEAKQETMRKKREAKFKLPDKGEYPDLGLNCSPSDPLTRPSSGKRQRMRGAVHSAMLRDTRRHDNGNFLDASMLMAGNRSLDIMRRNQAFSRAHQVKMRRMMLNKSRFQDARHVRKRASAEAREVSTIAIGGASEPSSPNSSPKGAESGTQERSAKVEDPEGEEASFEIPSGAEGDGEDNADKSNAAAPGVRIDGGTSEDSQSSSDSTAPTSALQRRKSVHMERRKSVRHALPDTIDESESDSTRNTLKLNMTEFSLEGAIGAAGSPKVSDLSVDDVLGPRGRRASILSKRAFGKKRTIDQLDKKDESRDKDKDHSKETFGLMEMSPDSAKSSDTPRAPGALLGGALHSLKFLSAAHTDGKKKPKGDASLSIGDDARESGEAWGFQADEEPSPLMGGALQDDQLRSAVFADGRLTAGSSHSSSATADPTSSPTTPTPAGPFRDHLAEAAQVAAREQVEREHHRQRLSLFDGNAIELEIATRKLQELRGKLIAKYKSLPKAFDDLAGSRNASITLQALQDRFVKLLKYNILDAGRMAAIMATVEDISAGIGFASFMNIVRRFASPASSLLHFRARLVQRLGTIDAAFRVLGVSPDEELSIDLFERPMLGAGVVSEDARKLFRTVDAVQWKGPSGFLTLATVRFVLEHAHVLAWLAIFNSRLGGRTGVREAFGRLPALQKIGGIEEPVESATHLQSLLEPVGFPSDCVPALFDFLSHRTPHKVTIAGLIHVMHHAFEEQRYGVPTVHDTVGIPGGPTEAVRDQALMFTMQLRRRVMQQFANYQVAYDAFHAKRPGDGITLDEWEQAVETFWSNSASSFALVFGHMCDFQHVRWDPKYKDKEVRINLAKFADALNGVAPCQSLGALRQRLLSVEKCKSSAQAWTLFTGKVGKDDAESIHLTQWQHALLRHLNIPYEDAGRLFVLLRAIPCITHSSNHQLILRSTFMSGVRSQAAVDHNMLFQNLFLRLSRDFGCVSRAFEGYYPSEPLSLHDFEEKVGMLLGCKEADCRTLFMMLDNARDGLVAIDELMVALTETQEVYLPYIYASVNLKDTDTESRVQAGRTNGSLVWGSAASHMQRPQLRKQGTSTFSPVPQFQSPSEDDMPREGNRSRPSKKFGGESEELPTPTGLKTGSTTIPDDDSGVDSSADSAGEAAPRPQTVAADGSHHASGFPARSLVPVPLLAGWEQRDADRPNTSPQQGSTEAGITGGARRKSLHARGQGARPVPLAMQLRNLVQQRRTDEEHSNLVYTSFNAPDSAQPQGSSTSPMAPAHPSGRRPGAAGGATARSSVKTARLSAAGFTNLRPSVDQSSASAAAGRNSTSSAAQSLGGAIAGLTSMRPPGADDSALEVLSAGAATSGLPLSSPVSSAPRQKGLAKGSVIKVNAAGHLPTSGRSSLISMNGSGMGSTGQHQSVGIAKSVARPPSNRPVAASAIRNWLLN